MKGRRQRQSTRKSAFCCHSGRTRRHHSRAVAQKEDLKLKVRKTIGKAYSDEQKERMLHEARKARSSHIYFALTLALNAGMRDAEIKTLTWAQINFAKKFLAVGRSKTEGGEAAPSR
jgi:integrase